MLVPRTRIAIALAGVLSGAEKPAAGFVHPAESQPPVRIQRIDLAQSLVDGVFRIVNREVTPLGDRNGVRVSAKPGAGLIWITGSDFQSGAIEVDVRGRDVFQQSFVGLAFHGKDDANYEAVYLRPFNFRADDPNRRQHAVQYVKIPEYDWPRLRQEYPEEFENPVEASIVPTDWVKLRVVVNDQTIQVFVGPGPSPALETRRLGNLDRGMVGLWVGNTSDGDFANLIITSMR